MDGIKAICAFLKELLEHKDAGLIVGVFIGVGVSKLAFYLSAKERMEMYKLLERQLSKKDELLSNREERIEKLHQLLVEKGQAVEKKKK